MTPQSDSASARDEFRFANCWQLGLIEMTLRSGFSLTCNLANYLCVSLVLIDDATITICDQ